MLWKAGFDFEVRPSKVGETRLPNETAEEFTARLAREKALEVATTAPRDGLVLGVDTVVVLDGKILGKPTGSEDAARMLRMLSGSTHLVITGVCLVRAPDRVEALRHDTTLVTFRSLDEQEILSYIASGEPFDKAGAYAIQGLASKFVTRIEGSYFNVMGLPVALVYELLKSYGASNPTVKG